MVAILVGGMTGQPWVRKVRCVQEEMRDKEDVEGETVSQKEVKPETETETEILCR
jgi:hypothetical protein